MMNMSWIKKKANVIRDIGAHFWNSENLYTFSLKLHSLKSDYHSAASNTILIKGRGKENSVNPVHINEYWW